LAGRARSARPARGRSAGEGRFRDVGGCLEGALQDVERPKGAPQDIAAVPQAPLAACHPAGERERCAPAARAAGFARHTCRVRGTIGKPSVDPGFNALKGTLKTSAHVPKAPLATAHPPGAHGRCAPGARRPAAGGRRPADRAGHTRAEPRPNGEEARGDGEPTPRAPRSRTRPGETTARRAGSELQLHRVGVAVRADVLARRQGCRVVVAQHRAEAGGRVGVQDRRLVAVAE